MADHQTQEDEDARLEQELQDYFDREDELSPDEEEHYRWLLRVVAGQ